eukprot:CAMPEP_0168234210 /NCGR_PEP_ID=MMETSP0140_2-20121125/18137_1 /TAXON_ID=44445 /ORGANISM="Pseudo-nitzschia australis, Strain 10249 10 AB" /LENGTH=586 /DNA_ID=CAMNT_0008166973 /DNA_START=28 /DNA_END=1788 /DNA_ORIENTATION=+
MTSAKKGNGRKRRLESGRNKQGQSSPNAASAATATSSLSSSSPSSSLFLTSRDSGFEKHIEDHYKGFAHCSADQLQPPDFHQQAKAALERLRDANYYQYDIVMAGGKHSSRTFVKRTLVGNPGITYKYLGLRLFAHAWSGPGVSPLMRPIGEMNQRMIHITKQFQNHQKCDYNLTLINYMEPTIHTRVGFKDEANYGMGKVSVSWHADSSLESGSSIGVYHCLPTQRSAKWDWRLALRPSPGTNNNNKPVVIDTKDGDAYFLLGNFNETHQHCVLAGSQSNRISSTHRVAVTQEDTYDYILKRVKIARKRFRLQLKAIESLSSTTSDGDDDDDDDGVDVNVEVDAKVIRYCQRVLTEVEAEWIAQYWLQGAQHDKIRTWWQRPMKTLEAYWHALEIATSKLCRHVCCSDATTTTKRKIPLDVAKVLIQEFKTRQSLRQQWDERRADKIYQRRIAEEYRPVARPIFDEGDRCNGGDDESEKRLPKDLTSAIRDLKVVVGTAGPASKTVGTSIDDSPLPAPSKSKQSDPVISDISSTTATTTNAENVKKVDASKNASTKSGRPMGKQESKSQKKRRRNKKKKADTKST